MDFGFIPSEVGVDFVVGNITDNHQWGIAEVFAVLLELAVSLFKIPVLVLAFVFPRKASFVPNIGPSMRPLGAERCGAGDLHALLESEGVTNRIDLSGFLLAEELAEVEKMFL